MKKARSIRGNKCYTYKIYAGIQIQDDYVVFFSILLLRTQIINNSHINCLKLLLRKVVSEILKRNQKNMFQNLYDIFVIINLLNLFGPIIW